MVKIKTSPDKTSKVTIADLNANVIKLTEAMNKYQARLNTTTYSRPSSSSKKTTNSGTTWYGNAARAGWNGGELPKQTNNLGNLMLGGLTGLNPIVIQKLGLDKAVKSIFKSTFNGIKKNWIKAFGESNSTKVNSAIESNKVSPVTKRLDKIYGLIDKRLGGGVKGKEEEKKKNSFLGKLLSFMGGLVKSVLPLLKIAGALAILKTIWDGLQKFFNWMGMSDKPLGEKAGIAGGTVEALKNNTATALPKVREGIENTTKKIKNVEENIRDINEWKKRTKKFTPEERARALKSENELKKIAKEKGLSEEEINELKETRKTLHEDNKVLKENYSAKERSKFAETIVKNTKKPYNWAERNIVPKTSNGVPITRSASALRIANSVNRAGETALNVMNGGLEYAGKAAPWIAAGLTALEYANAKTQEEKNQAIAGGIGAYEGGALAGAAAYALNPLSKFPNPFAQAGAIAGGVAAAVGGGDVMGDTARAGMAGYDTWRDKNKTHSEKQAEVENKLSEYSNQVKMLANTFEQPIVGENDEWKWWAYTKRYMPLVDPAFWKTAGYQSGVWAGQIKDWWERRHSPAENLESANKIVTALNTADKTQTQYGLATDFDSPITAADQASLPTEVIAQNTKTTNEYLSDILNTLQAGQLNHAIDRLDPRKPNVEWTTPPQGNTTSNSPFPTWQYISSKGRN